MHLPVYIGLLCRAERDLADGFRQVAEGHAADPDIYYTCHDLARQCGVHSKKLETFIERYGEQSPEEPDKLRQDFFANGTREGGIGLLRDLQDLYMMAHECDIAWTIVGQAAEGLRDAELNDTVDGCEPETEIQIKWLKTRMKQAAPQALIVAS